MYLLREQLYLLTNIAHHDRAHRSHTLLLIRTVPSAHVRSVLSDPTVPSVDYTMQLDPQLSFGLQSNLVHFGAPSPPDGVSLAEYARKQANVTIKPYTDYHGGRLPASGSL